MQFQPPRACYLQEGARAYGRSSVRLSGAVRARALGRRLAGVAAVLRAVCLRSGLPHHTVTLVSKSLALFSARAQSLILHVTIVVRRCTLVHACHISGCLVH